jgi:hypothetical protein
MGALATRAGVVADEQRKNREEHGTRRRGSPDSAGAPAAKELPARADGAAEKASFTSVRLVRQLHPGPFTARLALPQTRLRGLRLAGVEPLPPTGARVVSMNADVPLAPPQPVFTGSSSPTSTR